MFGLAGLVVWLSLGVPCHAQPAPADTLATSVGALVVQPVHHASFLLRWGDLLVAVDPVGDPDAYLRDGRPDVVLVTHKHRDHFDPDVLHELAGQHNVVIMPLPVAESVPAADPVVLAAGDTWAAGDLTVTAVPAYNRTAGRGDYHPLGDGIGYLLQRAGMRVYISGDTEDAPELAAIAPVDVAFLCMNLPWTMSVEQAARAVKAIRPRVLYPYHYRNRDGSLADLDRLRSLVDGTVDVRLLAWY
ncbi:MAG: MBL fold metallo-hydrolase [Candidatus Krumholzibacteriia bacterium]